MLLTIIASGVRMQRECTPTELLAVGRELQLRQEALRDISLRITVQDGSVTHIICNKLRELR